MIKIYIKIISEMNLTDESIEDFINYSIQKMNNKYTESYIRDFYSIFYKEDPQKIIHLFRKNIPLINSKINRKYIRRLGKEFHLLDKKDFYRVFYQVSEIMELTKDIINVIRGSSGSSIICYLLGITNIDPILNKICLARFMNTFRNDMPDIDIDFPSHLRNEVYKRIFTHFEGRVARISNHVKYGQKTALKRALKNNGITGFIPKHFNYKELIKKRLDITDDDDLLEIEGRILEEARIFVGVEKNTSLHCGGIFITENPIPEDIILKDISIDNTKAYQVILDKDETEEYGFIKIDILSNRGLSQIVDIYKDLTNDNIILPHFSELPLEPDVFTSLTNNNIGLTYAESRGIYKIFQRLKPKSIDDISICLALIRPAASLNGQKSEYLRSLEIQPTNPIDNSAKPWVIYDDDAITYISTILNITEDEADVYRKAFAKNNIYKIREFRKKISEKYSRDQVDEVILQLESLQEYGFCKSHSYSYAYLVYALAYLKYHYPIQFWKATLNHCHSSFRSWVHYREASRHLAIVEGMKPYKISNDKKRLIPMNNSVQLKLFVNSISDLKRIGYWTTSTFIEGMYYFTTNIKNKNGDLIKKAHFKGLIATYRLFHNRESPLAKNSKLTFITLGYDNGKYIDIIVKKHMFLGKFIGISGDGKIDDYGNITCKTAEPFSN